MVATRFTCFRNFDTIPRFSIGQWYRVAIKRPCPLTLVAGFSPNQIKWCLMHSVHLGVCQWLNASGIYELIQFNYLSQIANPTLSDHLHEFTRRLNAWCAMNRIRQLMGKNQFSSYFFLKSSVQLLWFWNQALPATHPNSFAYCASWRLPRTAIEGMDITTYHSIPCSGPARYLQPVH